MKYIIPPHHPKVVVISAPSGAGKTTLNRRLMKEHPEVEISISHTTRKPRPGEVDGVHYHFTSPEQFQEMVNQDLFVEWANVHGNLYGTSLGEISRIAAKGHVALLEIDVQGWAITRKKIPAALSIFITPPTLKDLWDRLEGRGSESLQSRWMRFENAHDEIEHAENYQFFLVNDVLEQCYAKLEKLVITGSLGPAELPSGQEICKKLHDEYETAPWIKDLRERVQKA